MLYLKVYKFGGYSHRQSIYTTTNLQCPDSITAVKTIHIHTKVHAFTARDWGALLKKNLSKAASKKCFDEKVSLVLNLSYHSNKNNICKKQKIKAKGDTCTQHIYNQMFSINFIRNVHREKRSCLPQNEVPPLPDCQFEM